MSIDKILEDDIIFPEKGEKDMVIETAALAIVGIIGGLAIGSGVTFGLVKRHGYDKATTNKSNKKNARSFQKIWGSTNEAKNAKEVKKIFNRNRKILKRGRLTTVEQVECMNLAASNGFDGFVSLKNLRKNKAAKKLILARNKKRILQLKSYTTTSNKKKNKYQRKINALNKKISASPTHLLENGFFRPLEKNLGYGDCSFEKQVEFSTKERDKKGRDRGNTQFVIDPLNRYYGLSKNAATTFGNFLKPKSDWVWKDADDFKRFRVDFKCDGDKELLPIAFVSTTDESFKIGKLVSLCDVAREFKEGGIEKVRIIDESQKTKDCYFKEEQFKEFFTSYVERNKGLLKKIEKFKPEYATELSDLVNDYTGIEMGVARHGGRSL